MIYGNLSTRSSGIPLDTSAIDNNSDHSHDNGFMGLVKKTRIFGSKQITMADGHYFLKYGWTYYLPLLQQKISNR